MNGHYFFPAPGQVFAMPLMASRWQPILLFFKFFFFDASNQDVLTVLFEKKLKQYETVCFKTVHFLNCSKLNFCPVTSLIQRGPSSDLRGKHH